MSAGISTALRIGAGEIGLPGFLQCGIIHPLVAPVHQPRISIRIHRESNPQRSLLILVIEQRIIAVLLVVADERMRHHHLIRITRHAITEPVRPVRLILGIRVIIRLVRECLKTGAFRSRQRHRRNLPAGKISGLVVGSLALRKGFETLDGTPTVLPIPCHAIPFPDIRPIVIGGVRRKTADIGTERTGRCVRGISLQVFPFGQITLTRAEIEARLVNLSCCSRKGTQQGRPC